VARFEEGLFKSWAVFFVFFLFFSSPFSNPLMIHCAGRAKCKLANNRVKQKIEECIRAQADKEGAGISPFRTFF